MTSRAAARRALAGALVAGVLLAAGTGPAAAAQAPQPPTGLTVGGRACGAGGAVYVNDRTPDVAAVTRGSEMGSPRQVVTFQVVRVSSGATVWTGRGEPGASSPVSLTVDPGLSEGAAHELRVRVKEVGGGTSTTVRCRFAVDTIGPGPVRIVPLSPADTPVGAPRKFRLVGDADAVAFRFDQNELASGGELPATDGRAVVTFTAKFSGPTTLVAQAVDRAGNSGPEKEYHFNVPTAWATHKWRFDEGAGRVAADAYGDQPLAVTSSTRWVAERQYDGTLLRFDGSADAATAPAVVDTTTSFGLAATLVPTTRDARIAVSQAASKVTAVALGVVRDTRCPTGDGVCFAVSLRASDQAGAPRTRVMSDVPVVPGNRYRVVATWNAVAGTASMWVYDKDKDPWSIDPPVTVPVAAVAPSSGVFRVGSAKLGREVLGPWRGGVDDVIVLTGVVDEVLARVMSSLNG